jgi:uncharacterized protein YjbI with pentapeptide repeats
MANEEQLAILKQGVEVWNQWRKEYPAIKIDLRQADLDRASLSTVDFAKADLTDSSLVGANLNGANLKEANLFLSDLSGASLLDTNLSQVSLIESTLVGADLSGAYVAESSFRGAEVAATVFGGLDLSETIGLKEVDHYGPSRISTDTFVRSKGKIPELFLRGCGLSDWEVELVKLYDPDYSNEGLNEILHKMYDLCTCQSLQISPLFISYSHADGAFVDKLESLLNAKGVRFWRDIHDMKAGRVETQIDRAIHQNRTVLLVLSKHSTRSDWVEHEVRTARALEKDAERDVLCPIALDDSWKNSHWPKRIMEQITEYNILDFSAWQDDSKFDSMFRKLIDGLELFYKG